MEGDKPNTPSGSPPAKTPPEPSKETFGSNPQPETPSQKPSEGTPNLDTPIHRPSPSGGGLAEQKPTGTTGSPGTSGLDKTSPQPSSPDQKGAPGPRPEGYKDPETTTSKGAQSHEKSGEKIAGKAESANKAKLLGDKGMAPNIGQISKKAEVAKDVAEVAATKNVVKLGGMLKKAATDEEYRQAFVKIAAGAGISMFLCCCFVPFAAFFLIIFILGGEAGQTYMQQRNLYNSCPSATFQTGYANDIGMPSFRNYADQCTTSDDFWTYYTKNASAQEPLIEDKVIAAIDQAGIPGTNNQPLCLGDNCPLENCNIKCSDQPCDQTPTCKSNIYPNASCTCAPSCAKAQCIQDCATKNLQTMQTRSKLIADRIRNIFEAEKKIITVPGNSKSDTDLPIFDSWKTNSQIGDRGFDTVCSLFYDFALFDLTNPNKVIDYSQCANTDWTIKNYQDFNLFPDIQGEDVQCPNECVKTENCKCLQRSVLGTVTAYKYMIGYLQTDRCKNCQNPWPSLVCQEDGIEVDIDGKTGCVEAPEYWCLNCNCEDCQSLIGSGIVPGSASYYSTIGVMNGIPNELIDPLTKAAARYRISPLFLAAVFSGGEHGGLWPTSGPWAVGSSGDSGPFQFLECTWEGWNQSLCKNGTGKANGVFETNQQIIDSIGGYGQDGNSDNVADVNNFYDAAFAAADYLARAGATENGLPVTDEKKLHDAAAKYNGGGYWRSAMAQNYADRVMKVYKKITN